MPMIPRPPAALRTMLTLAAGLLLACDGAVDPETGPTYIRFVNAAPDADGPLRFTMQGGTSVQLHRGESSAYAAAEERAYAITITDDSDHWTIADDLEVVGGLYQTLIAFGEASSAGGVLVGDEPGAPPANQFLLRVLHLAPHVTGQVELRIVAAGQDARDGTLAASQLTYPSSRGFGAFNQGSWRLVVTDVDDNAIVVDSGVLSFGAGVTYTAILMNAADGTPELVRLRDGA